MVDFDILDHNRSGTQKYLDIKVYFYYYYHNNKHRFFKTGSGDNSKVYFLR